MVRKEKKKDGGRMRVKRLGSMLLSIVMTKKST